MAIKNGLFVLFVWVTATCFDVSQHGRLFTKVDIYQRPCGGPSLPPRDPVTVAKPAFSVLDI
jgi:hypothetical protein